jgi:hypothetical protein
MNRAFEGWLGGVKNANSVCCNPHFVGRASPASRAFNRHAALCFTS